MIQYAPAAFIIGIVMTIAGLGLLYFVLRYCTFVGGLPPEDDENQKR